MVSAAFKYEYIPQTAAMTFDFSFVGYFSYEYSIIEQIVTLTGPSLLSLSCWLDEEEGEEAEGGREEKPLDEEM